MAWRTHSAGGVLLKLCAILANKDAKSGDVALDRKAEYLCAVVSIAPLLFESKA